MRLQTKAMRGADAAGDGHRDLKKGLSAMITDTDSTAPRSLSALLDMPLAFLGFAL